MNTEHDDINKPEQYNELDFKIGNYSQRDNEDGEFDDLPWGDFNEEQNNKKWNGMFATQK
jgi:hypothetical protein